MKAFVLIACLLFFIKAIVDTPKNLSKSIYFEKQRHSLGKIIDFKRMFPDILETTVRVSIAHSLLRGVITIFCLFWIASHYKENAYIFVVSLLQLIHVFAGLIQFPEAAIELERAIEEETIERIKFRRWYRLLGTILDYAYYPIVIFLLMTT